MQIKVFNWNQSSRGSQRCTPVVYSQCLKRGAKRAGQLPLSHVSPPTPTAPQQYTGMGRSAPPLSSSHHPSQSPSTELMVKGGKPPLRLRLDNPWRKGRGLALPAASEYGLGGKTPLLSFAKTAPLTRLQEKALLFLPERGRMLGQESISILLK